MLEHQVTRKATPPAPMSPADNWLTLVTDFAGSLRSDATSRLGYKAGTSAGAARPKSPFFQTVANSQCQPGRRRGEKKKDEPWPFGEAVVVVSSSSSSGRLVSDVRGGGVGWSLSHCARLARCQARCLGLVCSCVYQPPAGFDPALSRKRRPSIRSGACAQPKASSAKMARSISAAWQRCTIKHGERDGRAFKSPISRIYV